MKAHTDRVQEIVSIAPLFERAKAAQAQADAAIKELSAVTLEWLRKQLPVGTVIDLRHDKNKPEYLRNVRVSSGNGRGTQLFRIECIQSVEPPAAPRLRPLRDDAEHRQGRAVVAVAQRDTSPLLLLLLSAGRA